MFSLPLLKERYALASSGVGLERENGRGEVERKVSKGWYQARGFLP